MRLVQTVCILALALVSTPVAALARQDPEPYVEKQIVIVQSTKSYAEALATAKRAAAKIGSRLELRGLGPNKKLGLTFGKDACENDGFPYPCYLARGRGDDGTYVSVEHSSAFEGFAKGYYIVVAASYSKGSEEGAAALRDARKHFSDAYAKTTSIYVGCMH